MLYKSYSGICFYVQLIFLMYTINDMFLKDGGNHGKSVKTV